MSEHLVAEVAVNVGEVPNSPGFKVAARLGLGEVNSGNIRTTFREKTGQELEDLTLHLVIPARSAEGAEEIRSAIQATITKFEAGEGIDPKLAALQSIVAKSDSEDFEGQPKFVFTVSVHDQAVVVKVKPIEQMREMVAAQFEMVSGLAGDVLQKNQEVYFEFDMGKAFSELVPSQNWLLDAADSLSFKLWIHLHPQIFTDLTNLASNLGAPDQILQVLGTLGLFNSTNLNFNFRSSSELPQDLKEGLAKLSNKSKDPNIHNEIPEGVKKFFGHFANGGTGNLHIFAALQTNALFIDLHTPGLSKFLSE